MRRDEEYLASPIGTGRREAAGSWKSMRPGLRPLEVKAVGKRCSGSRKARVKVVAAPFSASWLRGELGEAGWTSTVEGV